MQRSAAPLSTPTSALTHVHICFTHICVYVVHTYICIQMVGTKVYSCAQAQSRGMHCFQARAQLQFHL